MVVEFAALLGVKIVRQKAWANLDRSWLVQ